jgi:hypothetical protein
MEKIKIAYKGMPAFLDGLHMGRFTRDIYSGDIPHHHDFQYNDGSFPSFGEVIPKYVIDAMSADRCIQSDPTNPNHYKSHPSKVECIQITEHMNFCRGNAIKYIWRAGEKGNEIEDLEKAKWYIEREI